MYFFRLLYLFKIDNHDTAMDNCGNKVNKDPVCNKVYDFRALTTRRQTTEMNHVYS